MSLAPRAQAEPQETLTVAGNIVKFTDASNKSYVLTWSDLDKLPRHAITTATEWTPKGTFEGPLLRDVLAKAGAKGQKIKLYAEDDYNVTIPASDLDRYNVILANRWNGKPMRREDYGPFWLMYPLPSMSESEVSGVFISKLIWQVFRIEIR
ncbi:molybdopterin-dependent oxidoreductase [Chromobacterium sp. IIBBL 290-4]|uniref:molybdopterin-dependent oxidoreductase n=1 Tax=Chromobacterium sp. IIBBL 290-4 TaxID=2953890 RepID=UPI0020B7CD97|nr:molybdopterin-dependent oxidoreductase [Chromobacterium sp. IIBBL 290-4]UTH72881.1 molybdopterin-dependent oxidoreductase [Chromobacterium sp. IIBBL 290-4]